MESLYNLVDDCALYLNRMVPRWNERVVSPIEALRRGSGNCAARSVLGAQYLMRFGVEVKFAYSKRHGDLEYTGEAKIGHAIMFVANHALAPGINSDARGEAFSTSFTSEDLKRYHTRTPEEGYAEYVQRLSGETDIIGDLEEVQLFLAKLRVPANS
jgi:hypothetical protein